jgi:hypothetical protein
MNRNRSGFAIAENEAKELFVVFSQGERVLAIFDLATVIAKPALKATSSFGGCHVHLF